MKRLPIILLILCLVSVGLNCGWFRPKEKFTHVIEVQAWSLNWIPRQPYKGQVLIRVFGLRSTGEEVFLTLTYTDKKTGKAKITANWYEGSIKLLVGDYSQPDVSVVSPREVVVDRGKSSVEVLVVHSDYVYNFSRRGWCK